MQQSTRLEERWKSPRFLCSDFEGEGHPFFFKTSFEFQGKRICFFCQTDSRGTVKSLFYHTLLKELYLAVLDVFVEFLQGKKRREFFLVSLREIENYLRDENKKQAFLISSEMEKLLDSSSHLLVQGIGEILVEAGRGRSFDSLSRLMDKIEAVEHVLEKYVRPLLRADGGEMELIHIQGKEITLLFQGECRSCPGSSGGSKRAVEGIFKKKLHTSSIKLLAG